MNLSARPLVVSLAALAWLLAPPAIAAEAAPAKSSPPTEQSCAAQGGTLAKFGIRQQPGCLFRYSDAGRACTDGAQCKAKRCLAPKDAGRDPAAPVIGTCAPTNNFFGCNAWVTDGKASRMVCID